MRRWINPKADVVATRNVKDLKRRKELISVLSSCSGAVNPIRGILVAGRRPRATIAMDNRQ